MSVWKGVCVCLERGLCFTVKGVLSVWNGVYIFLDRDLCLSGKGVFVCLEMVYICLERDFIVCLERFFCLFGKQVYVCLKQVLVYISFGMVLNGLNGLTYFDQFSSMQKLIYPITTKSARR